MRILPDSQYNRELILQALETANEFAEKVKITSQAEPFAWLEKHNLQIVCLKLYNQIELNPEHFSTIGKIQLLLLKALNKKGNKMKVCFIVDTGHLKLDKSYLSPMNYENIAKRLLQEETFEGEIMIIRPKIISTFVKAGVLAISRLIPGSRGRFFVVNSFKEANRLLLQHYS